MGWMMDRFPPTIECHVEMMTASTLEEDEITLDIFAVAAHTTLYRSRVVAYKLQQTFFALICTSRAEKRSLFISFQVATGSDPAIPYTKYAESADRDLLVEEPPFFFIEIAFNKQNSVLTEICINEFFS